MAHRKRPPLRDIHLRFPPAWLTVLKQATLLSGNPNVADYLRGLLLADPLFRRAKRLLRARLTTMTRYLNRNIRWEDTDQLDLPLLPRLNLWGRPGLEPQMDPDLQKRDLLRALCAEQMGIYADAVLLDDLIPPWCTGIDPSFWASPVGDRMARLLWAVHSADAVSQAVACRTIWGEDSARHRKKLRQCLQVYPYPVKNGRLRTAGYVLRSELEQFRPVLKDSF